MTSTSTPASGGYQPGVCNIGPAEVGRRRRAGHTGAILAIGLFIVLVALGTPALWRLLVALPAAIGAVGYVQARRRFCAGFAMQGVFNLGELGSQTSVADPDAARRDRAAALRLFAEAAIIGLLVGVIAVVLPV
ncbi:MAG: hypothetical protein LH650_03090 [Chloroflexi bacterium]|nr:hypothetical protein [Chloroflexota bacterium]